MEILLGFLDFILKSFSISFFEPTDINNPVPGKFLLITNFYSGPLSISLSCEVKFRFCIINLVLFFYNLYLNEY